MAITRIMSRPNRVRRAALAFVVAVAAAVAAGPGIAGTAQAALATHRAQAAAGLPPGLLGPDSGPGAKPCFSTGPDCSSTDPSVHFQITSQGDTRGCEFTYTTKWGDGKSDMMSFGGGADGSVLATFRHTYPKDKHKTYTIVATGKTIVGMCFARGSTLHFTLTAHVAVAAVRFAPLANRQPGTLGLPVIKDDGPSPVYDTASGPATCAGVAEPRTYDYLDCGAPLRSTPAKSWPVIYAANDSLGIDKIVFVADGPVPSPVLTAAVTLSGPGSGLVNLTLAATPLTSSKVGGKYQLTASIFFTGTLPAVPGKDTLRIAWTITQTDSGATINAGTSRHTLYVTAQTFAPPQGPGADQVDKAYVTLVDVGTMAAAGKSGQTNVLNAIWRKFETRKIAHPRLDLVTGAVSYGPTLKYYNDNYPKIADWFNKHIGSCPDFAEMLAANTGHCGNWAQFLAGVLAFQGISATAVDLDSAPDFNLGPDPEPGERPDSFVYMLVGPRLWSFGHKNASGNYPYRDKLTVAADGQVAINGGNVKYSSTDPIAQGPVSDPPMMFLTGDHAIVDVNLLTSGTPLYLDPSYGNPQSTTFYPTIPRFEKSAIAGFAVIYKKEHHTLVALRYGADIATDCKNSTCYFAARPYS